MNTELNNFELTDQNIEDIVNTAESARQEHVSDIEVDEDAALQSEVITTPSDSAAPSPIDIIAAEVENMPESDLSIFDTDKLDDENQAAIEQKVADTSKGAFDLSDEEAMSMLELLKNYKSNPNYPVFDNMPRSMQDGIRRLAMEGGLNVPLNTIARMFLDNMINDAKIDSAYIDFQKSIDEALNVPSVMDLYSEHTDEVMNKHIPEMIERIKGEEPEKAAILQKIREAFMDGYSFVSVKRVYESDARVRKSVRRCNGNRNNSELKHAITEFNYANEKTNFKMRDVSEVIPALDSVLITEPVRISVKHTENGEEVPADIAKILKLDVSAEDILKFTTLICRSCKDLDPKSIVDAAYMYYMVRNITMLKQTAEAKTRFSAELISNICDVIVFIRNKEAEFNVRNTNKSKLSKKLHSTM